MDLEQNNSLAKLPLLKQEEGNSFKPVAQTTREADGTSTTTIPGAVTDAKSLFEVEARFGGNEATKKTQLDRLLKLRCIETSSALLCSKFPTNWSMRVLSRGHSSTNDGNTANVHVSTGSSPVSTASTNNSTACLSDATIYAYLATQPNGSQVVHEDLDQIHEDDLDEIDLKWQLALLSMKARKFYQRTGKKIIINGSDTAGYDKKKVECFNCHKLGNFARECRNPKSQENRSRNQDSSRRTVNVEEASPKAMLAIDGTGFDDRMDGLLVVLNSPYFMVKSWLVHDQTVLGQTTTGKEFSNPFMAGSLPKTISPMIHISQEVVLLKEERTINMLVDKKYPLKKEILKKMINLKIEAEEESDMASELIKFIKSQIAEQMKDFASFALQVMEIHPIMILIRTLSMESTIPLNEIVSQIPPSIAIMPVLPTLEPEDSRIMVDEHLSTIPEKESDEFIKSSVEDLVPIPSESEDLSESDSDCNLPSCDDFSPINIYEEKSVTFSNPLFDSNDDFTSSDDESLSDEDVPEDNVKIYSNPLFEFDDEYISSDVNPLFDDELENIESKDSYVSNLDEPTLFVTPFSNANENECFDPGGDIDEIDAFLDIVVSTNIVNDY
ncbi:putative ribonuclease H-like domain-containing protein [Tanacetum coccineum]